MAPLWLPLLTKIQAMFYFFSIFDEQFKIKVFVSLQLWTEFGSSMPHSTDDDKENTDSNPRNDAASDDGDDDDDDEVTRQSMLLTTQDRHLEMEDTEESQPPASSS